MQPLKLALDIDGVFSDFNGHPDTHGFARVLKETSKRDLFPRPWTPDTWGWWTALGYKKSESDAAWVYVTATSYFWSGLRPYAGAEKALARIQRRINTWHVQVTFLTTRPGDSAHWQSVEWLHEYGISRPQVCICHNAASKALIAKALGCHVFIDDYVENHKAMLMHDPSIRRFLVRQPYNVGLDDQCGGGVQILDTLDELVVAIDHLAPTS